MDFDGLTKKKSRLDGFYPLPDALKRNLEAWLRIELTHTSNALEGNSLTRTDIIEEGGLLKIGELARRVGENNSTIRYWTKAGLLEVADFTGAGYQLYAFEMIGRVGEIKRLKERRLTLQEIRVKID